MLRSASAWMRSMMSGRPFAGEQVGKALLRPQVVLDRHLAADRVTAVTSPRSASNTGKSPLSRARRARLDGVWLAAPQPSGQGTRMCR
jgi:hypothetical protein